MDNVEGLRKLFQHLQDARDYASWEHEAGDDLLNMVSRLGKEIEIVKKLISERDLGDCS